MRFFFGLCYLLLLPFALIAQAYTGIIVNPPQKSTLIFEESPRNTFETNRTKEKVSLAPQLLLSDASLLLAQASISPDWADLHSLQHQGLEAWIKEQIQLPPSFLAKKLEKWELILEQQTNIDVSQTPLAFQLANWQNALTAKDQLRQRMAWALEEVFQRSLQIDRSRLSAQGQGQYMDVLIKHALGNYEELLIEILSDSTLGQLWDIGREKKPGLKSLLKHPHTGHQLADALIEELLGQKPANGFIQRVAQAFNANEQGERGDLAAVVYAIFSDPEAQLIANQGKALDKALAIEPVLKYTFMCDFLNQLSLEELSAYFEDENWVLEESENVYLEAPDLLSFYHPFDMSLGDSDVKGSISQTQRIINFMEEVGQLENPSPIFFEEINPEERVSDDLDAIVKLSENPEELLEYLDILFVQGLLSDKYKKQILESIRQVSHPEDRFSMALYLIFISPDYKSLP